MVKCSGQLVGFDLDGGIQKIDFIETKFIISWILGSVRLNCEQKISTVVILWAQSIKILSI